MANLPPLETYPTISVAIYYPLDQSNYLNPTTWMLYINDPATQTSLHRIVYQPGDKTYHPTIEARYGAHPTYMRRYKEIIPVGHIVNEKMALARNEIQGVKVRKNTGSQTWVMDVLKSLEKEGYAVFKRRD
ncbi:MAG: hypothetical protein Q9172_003110 [Xanthocarpia lactea]